jgi:hypothetical protein
MPFQINGEHIASLKERRPPHLRPASPQPSFQTDVHALQRVRARADFPLERPQTYYTAASLEPSFSLNWMTALPRPPNFKQEKKRREEAQKKKNEEKQQEKAARKGTGGEPPKDPQ